MDAIFPHPFTFEKGEKAVLLLHGFTGNSTDVRMLGRLLESKGYTCHAPQYKGHNGDTPEELVETTPDDWWKDVLAGYDHLVENGHNEIAVAGISLGGLFSLKLAMEKPVVAVIPMCAPMGFQDESVLKEMIISYARNYKLSEGKSEKEVEREVLALLSQPIAAVEGLLKLASEVKADLFKVDIPLLVIQGRQDTVIAKESPDIIFQQARSTEKKLNWYEQSGHIITLDKERNCVEEDIFQFLEEQHWEEHLDLLFHVDDTNTLHTSI